MNSEVFRNILSAQVQENTSKLIGQGFIPPDNGCARTNLLHTAHVLIVSKSSSMASMNDQHEFLQYAKDPVGILFSRNLPVHGQS